MGIAIVNFLLYITLCAMHLLGKQSTVKFLTVILVWDYAASDISDSRPSIILDTNQFSSKVVAFLLDIFLTTYNER